MTDKNIKIDLVYLWVDGNDPEWKKNKDFWKQKYGESLKSDFGKARWRDNNELKYSLRSVEKYAPWINHIFIITDHQRPKWLNTSNPKISIIDQKEIMPADSLPCFNSVALETRIPFIPGLSEYFLYSCDDFFFGDYLSPDFFFDENNNPKVWVIRKGVKKVVFSHDDYKNTYKSKSIFRKSILKVIRMIYNTYGKKYRITICHNIEPLRKSYYIDTLNTFSEEIKTTTYNKFRTEDDVNRFIYSLNDNAKGRNTLYMNTYRGRAKTYNFKCFDSFSVTDLFKRRHKATLMTHTNILKKIKRHKPYLFCLNDGKQSFEKTTNELSTLFPLKSQFEKQ